MICNSKNSLMSQARAGKMAPRIKVLAAKRSHLSSVLGTIWYKERLTLNSCSLTSMCRLCNAHAHINTKKN